MMCNQVLIPPGIRELIGFRQHPGGAADAVELHGKLLPAAVKEDVRFLYRAVEKIPPPQTHFQTRVATGVHLCNVVIARRSVFFRIPGSQAQHTRTKAVDVEPATVFPKGCFPHALNPFGIFFIYGGETYDRPVRWLGVGLGTPKKAVGVPYLYQNTAGIRMRIDVKSQISPAAVHAERQVGGIDADGGQLTFFVPSQIRQGYVDIAFPDLYFQTIVHDVGEVPCAGV